MQYLTLLMMTLHAFFRVAVYYYVFVIIPSPFSSHVKLSYHII